MEKEQKRKVITQKINFFTRQITPGQTTKLGPEEVNHHYQVYLGRQAKPEEIKIYENHPDSSKLEKHLQLMRKDKPPVQQQPVINPGGLVGGAPGAGGGMGGLSNPFGGQSVADPNRLNFKGAPGQLASPVGRKLRDILAPIYNTSNSTPATALPLSSGFRTDRHNNPTAFTTDIAKMAGLVPNKDYTVGDAFPNNPNYHTARLKGNPIDQTIKVIDKIGFNTASGNPRWTYLSSIPGVQNWKQLNRNQKAQIISLMYKHEGGSGALTKGQGGYQGKGGVMTSRGLAEGTGGGSQISALNQLGNITTPYGGQTKDENFHPAIDVANTKGTPIPEMKGGTVTEVGQHPSYGNFIKVNDGRGNTQQYSHLQQAYVQPGQRVNKNQTIAAMGDSGNAYSPGGGDASHLDYSVVDLYNRYKNPTNYLNQT